MPKEELKNYFEGTIKGDVQTAIASAVAEALTLFCEQEPEFKEIICESGKTFQECLDEISKAIDKRQVDKHNAVEMSSMSDLEVYKRAVKFYDEGLDVEFVMNIRCSGPKHNITMTENKHERTLSLSLNDLLDF